MRKRQPADGTVEDQLSVAMTKISALLSKIEGLENRVSKMGAAISNASVSQAALADLMVTVLEVPGEVVVVAYENANMYADKQAEEHRGSVVGRVKSRQETLRKRLESMEG